RRRADHPGSQAHAGWLASRRRVAPVARHAAHLRPPARAPRAGNATQHFLRTEDAHMTEPTPTADLILHRGLFTTLERAQPTATAVAIPDGRFLAVGAD